MPMAYMPNLNQITLLQLDGIMSLEEYNECIQIGLKGCRTVYEIQKQALAEKYFSEERGS